jgi:two-component system, sensor histidine kinase YesM
MNRLSKLKIQTQLILFNSVIILVMVLIIFITYFQSSGIISSNNSEYTSQFFHQTSQELTANFDTLEKIGYSVAYNDMIQDFINQKEPLDKFENSQKLTNYLSGQMAISSCILDIGIIPNYGSDFDMVGIKKTLRSHAFGDGNAHPKAVNYSPERTISVNNQTKHSIFLTFSIYSDAAGSAFGNLIGKVVIAVDTSRISQYVTNMAKPPSGSWVYLTDGEGVVCASNNPSALGGKISDVLPDASLEEGSHHAVIRGVSMVVYAQDYSRLGGKIISADAQDKLLAKTRDVRQMDLALLGAAIVLMLLPFLLILKNIVTPIQKISHFVGGVRRDNPDTLKRRITLHGHAEVVTMADDFNGMLDEIESLTRELVASNTHLYETEISKKQAELAFLQSQINPHFLYNTLESIKGIALSRNAPEIRDMAQALADIFRYSIKGEDIVLLREEIAILKSYLIIQETRFAGRFETRYSVAEEALDCRIPKMILQPVAENAIYYGLEPKGELGHLDISCTLDGAGLLTVIIRDNGEGMDAERLEQVRRSLTEAPPAGKAGAAFRSIGLTNVNNRIRLKFGPQYGIHIESQQGWGTAVTLTVPVEEKHV